MSFSGPSGIPRMMDSHLQNSIGFMRDKVMPYTERLWVFDNTPGTPMQLLSKILYRPEQLSSYVRSMLTLNRKQAADYRYMSDLICESEHRGMVTLDVTPPTDDPWETVDDEEEWGQ